MDKDENINPSLALRMTNITFRCHSEEHSDEESVFFNISSGYSPAGKSPEAA